MLKHFGINFRVSKIGYKLTRENYVRISNKSTFDIGKIYDKEYCREHAIDSLINFDYNMRYFESLDKGDFINEIDNFLKINPQFNVVSDLNNYKEKPGFYLMVLDEYCQAYIGGARDICKRVRRHWTNQKPFDRLIFGYIDSSIMSIDSFRHLDTTRLYAYTVDDTFTEENRHIDCINPKFMCNRTIGGRLEGGLYEAIDNRKQRDLEDMDFEDIDIESKMTIDYEGNLDPSPVQLHEIFFKVNKPNFIEELESKDEKKKITNYNYSGKYGKYSFSVDLDKSLIIVKDIIDI